MRVCETSSFLRRALAALGLVLAACSSEAETFTLRLTWSSEGAQACPTGPAGAPTCSAIPVSCRSHALIRVMPLEGTTPYYTKCEPLPRTLDACGTAQIELGPSSPIPNEMVRVQVAVWPDELLVDPSDPGGAITCPDTLLFDDFGKPRIDTVIGEAVVVPALGGEIYFPVGDRRVAEVELGCPRHDLLDTDACRLGAPVVEATIYDPGTWARVNDPDALDVKFGKVTPDVLLNGWKLVGTDLDTLAYRGGGEELWRGQLTKPLPELGCLELVPAEPGSTRIASCHDMPMPFMGTPITLESVLIDRALLSKAVGALDGPSTDLPAAGMVLGFILDHNGHPAARAQIEGVESVKYPTRDFETTGLNETSETGIFLSTEASLPDTLWDARGSTGVGVVRPQRGGKISNHVTVVVLRLEQPNGVNAP